MAVLNRELAKAKEAQSAAFKLVRDIEHEIGMRRFVPVPGFTRILMGKKELESCAKGDSTYIVYFYNENGNTLGYLGVIKSDAVGATNEWGLNIARRSGFIGFSDPIKLGHTMTMMEAAQMCATILSERL